MDILAALFLVLIGYVMVASKKHWTINHETGKKEPHPLGFTLIIFGIFIFMLEIS